MKNFIKNNIIYIFYLLIICTPILDSFVGVSNSALFLIDYIIKFSFLLIVIYYLIFIDKTKIKYILILFIYSMLYCLINIIFKEKNDMIYEIKNLIKILYFPIIFIFLLTIKDKIRKRYLVYAFLIYLIYTFVPNILNVGNKSYEITKKGNVGFYISANLIGNIFSILYPIFFAYLLEKKKKIPLFILSIIYLITLLTVGTKGPFLCFFIMILYFIIYLLVKFLKEKKYKYLLVEIMTLILVIYLVIKLVPQTAFYSNIITHLEFLNIHSIKDLFTPKNIDHFVFGSRFKMLDETFEIYKNSSILNMLFGIGYSNNGEIKTCEMDYFVTIMHNGIFGFIIIYFYYFKTIFSVLKNYFSKIKENIVDTKKSLIFISIIFSIICALFIGHMFDSPSIAIYLSSIIIIYINNKKMHEK